MGRSVPRSSPKPRRGLCPELLADFRIPNLLGARRGAEGSFVCSLSSRFSGRGGGVGSLPRAWRRVGVPPRLYGFHWHSEPFESQGARAAKRYVNGNLVEREKGDEFGIETTAPPISPWISPWNISPTHDS